ncbi:hypothetical protein, partial [Salibacter sp.]|uniref:hypothetical protein n=1 Tax=Salibacter sp. TaxID=2010995 RepID=UPI002870810F
MTFRLIIILSFFISLPGLAQFNNNKIDFESFKRQFSPIPANSDTVHFWNTSWNNGQVTLEPLAIGFDFYWGGHSFDSLDVLSSGGFAFRGEPCTINEHGYTAFISWEILDRVYFLGLDNDTTYTDTSLTPVKYYRGTDSLGYKTFTVQWLNVPSQNYEGDSLSFQLKLYERDNSLEIHYGKLILDETTWPDFNIVAENATPFFYLYQDVDCDSQINNSLALVETNNDSATLHTEVP